MRGQGIRGQKSEVRDQEFVVRTPTALVTDIGTEFGVKVRESGRYRVPRLSWFRPDPDVVGGRNGRGIASTVARGRVRLRRERTGRFQQGRRVITVSASPVTAH